MDSPSRFGTERWLLTLGELNSQESPLTLCVMFAEMDKKKIIYTGFIYVLKQDSFGDTVSLLSPS